MDRFLKKRGLIVGDLIEIKQYELHGIIVKDVWLIAKIILIGEFNTYLAEIFKTKKLIWISATSYGEMWR